MPDPYPRRTWRRRLRFRPSVRALMVLVLGLAVVMARLTHQARAQRELFAALRAGGGWGHYEFKGHFKNVPIRTTVWPRWLRDSLGVDYFYSIVGTKYRATGADEIADRLARLGELEAVDFDQSDLTDWGLARLEGLDLCRLYLGGTKVTDSGLRHIRGLANLESLGLSSSAVGDRGMGHIASLSKLERLALNETKITDAGLEPLAKLRALTFLDLSHTAVGDEGAARLASMVGLKELHLERTRVSPSALEALRSALPGTLIHPKPSPPAAPGGVAPGPPPTVGLMNRSRP